MTWKAAPSQSFVCLFKLHIVAKRQDWDVYRRASLLPLRSAMERVILEKRQWDIIADPQFARSNAALDGQLKKLKREGKLCPVTQIITHEDLDKMKHLFIRNKESDLLMMQMWFYATYHFSLRGRELQRELRKDDQRLAMNFSGKEHLQLSVGFATKNHPGSIDDRVDPPVARRIQNTKQVFSIKMPLDHLHPNQPALFQRPRKCVPKCDQI